MKDHLAKIIADFSDLLEKRFEKFGERDAGEDDIRYMFFHACTENGIDANDIVLEKKDVVDVEEKNRPKLDTLVIGNGRRPSIAIEFKYHRQENNLKPQLFWAGRLLYDFYRLQNLKLKPPTRKLAVYVANGQMMKNYEKGAKSWGGPLSELTSMEDGAVLQLGLPDKAPKCFLERARHKNENGGFEEATVKCLHHTHYEAGGQCKSTNDLFVFEIVK